MQRTALWCERANATSVSKMYTNNTGRASLGAEGHFVAGGHVSSGDRANLGLNFFWILEISDDGCGAIAHAKSQETLWMVGCRRVEWAPQMSPRAAGALCAPRGSNRRSHVRRSVAAMAPISGIEGDGSTPATRVQLARTFCKALTSCPFAHSCTHLQLPPNCRRRFLSMPLAPLRPQAMGSSERHEEGID